MHESTTYQAIIEEGGGKRGKKGEKKGQLLAKRGTLFLQGGKQFGAPSAKVRRQIEKVSSLKRLDELLLRVLDAKDWGDLLSS